MTMATKCVFNTYMFSHHGSCITYARCRFKYVNVIDKRWRGTCPKGEEETSHI